MAGRANGRRQTTLKATISAVVATQEFDVSAAYVPILGSQRRRGAAPYDVKRYALRRQEVRSARPPENIGNEPDISR
jgi:hypothetical protein